MTHRKISLKFACIALASAGISAPVLSQDTAIETHETMEDYRLPANDASDTVC